MFFRFFCFFRRDSRVAFITSPVDAMSLCIFNVYKAYKDRASNEVKSDFEDKYQQVFYTIYSDIAAPRLTTQEIVQHARVLADQFLITCCDKMALIEQRLSEEGRLTDEISDDIKVNIPVWVENHLSLLRNDPDFTPLNEFFSVDLTARLK